MSELFQIIKTKIEKEGELSFKDYMEIALYHLQHGYYSCLEEGIAGDFYTSPEISSTFGKTLAVQLHEMMNYIDGDLFTIVEMGGGSGKLALPVLEYFQEKKLISNISYIMIDISPALQELQRKTLKKFNDYISWQSWEEYSKNKNSMEGVFLGNEFLDALPFHRFRGTSEGTMEIYIANSPDGFTEVLKEPSENMLQLLPALPEGLELELSLNAVSWLEDAKKVLKKGFILQIDYGDKENALIKEGGTVRAFKKHKLTGNILMSPGSMDITASVNFSLLENKAVELGFDFCGYTEQGKFLMALGILDEASNINFQEFNKTSMNFMLEIKRLIMPDGLGETHKAIAFAYGFSSETPKLKGFQGL